MSVLVDGGHVPQWGLDHGPELGLDAETDHPVADTVIVRDDVVQTPRLDRVGLDPDILLAADIYKRRAEGVSLWSWPYFSSTLAISASSSRLTTSSPPENSIENGGFWSPGNMVENLFASFVRTDSYDSGIGVHRPRFLDLCLDLDRSDIEPDVVSDLETPPLLSYRIF